jgi:hypothetical protein
MGGSETRERSNATLTLRIAKRLQLSVSRGRFKREHFAWMRNIDAGRVASMIRVDGKIANKASALVGACVIHCGK